MTTTPSLFETVDTAFEPGELVRDETNGIHVIASKDGSRWICHAISRLNYYRRGGELRDHADQEHTRTFRASELKAYRS